MGQSSLPERIRVGVIGANPTGGWAAFTHLPALQSLPGYRITAVSTTKQESASEAARRFDVPHAFASAEPLVEHPEVDLVVVSVRAPEHAKLVRLALAAGKHVFCEWPLGVSLEETTELAALAREAKVRTVIGLQRRLAPGVLYLRDLLREGYVGRVRSVSLQVSTPLLGERRPKSYEYTADATKGANVLVTMTAHFLDTVLAAVGDLSSVSALVARQFERTTLVETGEVIPVTAPDQVLLSGTLASGAVLSAHIESGKRNGGVIGCTITGTEGDLSLSQDLTVSGAKGDNTPLAPLPTPERYLWSPRGTLGDDAHQVAQLHAAFARDVREGTSLAPGFEDAVKLHRLMETFVEVSTSGVRRTL
ncbi:Gfo/Idh/MocA family oxidoreductase [Myxococcus stipitatus DSM 14675]|uniref:Gfo/Idh/MocA family oxidoreductase n=1 Tax=Myxococcus stipitatus (strain DSM 14675 / JCM 12634 / Mx s8) TaxID=1278073 RepID=L7UPD3_MYXSD|nr:Gfo/Idh/MocA family oxidoreductase [Myxococcus stipitatus]AGC48384.1 Gfo/Idh/MocA family oxidoreductase [Myxococcus stipitatus DSM 14675]